MIDHHDLIESNQMKSQLNLEFIMADLCVVLRFEINSRNTVVLAQNVSIVSVQLDYHRTRNEATCPRLPITVDYSQ